MKNLTIVDIAKIAGVSVSTVSRVLNKHPDVSDKTRQRVLGVMEESLYIPNNSARDLKRESMKAIAIIIKGYSNPFFSSMIPVIQNILENNRYTMLIHQLDANDDEVYAAISLCKEKKPRGLIFMGGNFDHSTEKLNMINVPYVMLTMTLKHNISRDEFSSVTIDDFQAGYQIADKICSSGHTKVAVIASNRDDMSISRLRVEGFKQSLRENNIRFPDSNIAYAKEFTRAAGYECAKQLLKSVDFTCLFCVSDLMALGAIRAIHDAGLSVPQDISVIGFDGLDEGRYSIPSLATVKQPAKEMATQSVNILLSRLRTGAPYKHKLLKATFLEGESFMQAIPG